MVKNYLYCVLTYLNTCSLGGLLRSIRLKLTGKTILLSGSCRCCGACCQKINLEMSGGWVRSEAVFKKVVEDHPEFGRFEVIGKDQQGFLQFSCSWYSQEGLCRDYAGRLAICRNFPETSLLLCGGSLPKGCSYRFHEGVPFAKVLDREKRKIR